MPEPLLEMKGIRKSFGGNVVLSDVDLTVWPHEVHALVGENGAGKSTLMKILAGVYARDAGSIMLEDRQLQIAGPHDARRAGISMIFQEHALAPHLTVAGNIFLGMEPLRRSFMVDNREAERRAGEVLRRQGFTLDPATPVRRLTRAERQMVEIARALTSATRVVVMDEPTVMLSTKECEELFRIIGELRTRGLAIVYISHRLEELPRIADRITILRDGRRVHSGEYALVDNDTVIRHMVGREIRDLYPKLKTPRREVVFDVRGLGDGRRYRNVSFVLREGEILGLAGLVGAGRTALARGLFGLETPREGAVELRGRRIGFCSAGQAIKAGLAYLTEDREITSLFPHLSLAHNISVAGLERVTRAGMLRLAEEAKLCRGLISELRIRSRSAWEPIYALSGGNQQKALIARWIFARSTILILDEPTQGVDLGARAEIYRLMRDIAARGGAILMVSSDMPELLGMTHRIAVMRRGEIAATLETAGTNQEEIMRYAALVN